MEFKATNINLKICASAFVSAVLSVGTLAGEAPANPHSEVIITGVGTDMVTASGSLSVTRYTGNSMEWISCGMEAVSETENNAFCNARDVNDNRATCWTDQVETDLLQKISSINEMSYVAFATNPDGSCQYITVSNRSANLGAGS